MYVAQELRKTNIAEYLLYMWQIEDIIRVYGCDMGQLRRNYLSKFNYNEEQMEEEELWFTNLIRMMNQEGTREKGHLQINQVTMQQLSELNAELLRSTQYPFYTAEYYKVLPFIVELRRRGADMEEPEIETCFNALYGMMMLRLQNKEISPDTDHAVKEITTFIGMLNDYYLKDKQEPLEF
jgi:hypothetical protein